ncbi:Dihydrodipicolinate reductase [Staphylococcus aureus]|uniref:Dihydrodipicolinate reductase n=1 Tax=Staphylococcus aureus TaxID=1280 RepID=A0A380EHI6_STAAU|nr:Dihydrodipicolinate reductase [Staphylococcus aureus]
MKNASHRYWYTFYSWRYDVGEHEVLFAGTDETIQITHRAQSKDIFANGAIQAAERLVNKPNGFYTFDNL